MKSWVCADAGLALLQVLREPLCDLADALWADWNRRGVTIIAPVLWGYEVTSVIRKNTFRKLLAPEDEQNALDAVHRLPVEQWQPAGLHQRAWALAHRFNRPAAYDVHYLALADMVGCPFWTSDERLFNAVHAELSWVHWLGHYREPEVLHERQADNRAGRR
jgi:predicted nucleic acid-binding protein